MADEVRLEPVGEHNLKAVFDLPLGPGQETFVAPNPWSLAEAFVHHTTAWPRAIVADGAVVGFLMLQIDPDDPAGQPFYLWRLMVGADHQRRGYGAAAVRLAVEEVRRRGGTALHTSWVPGEGTPEPFYRGLGFEPTGEMDGDEVVARLDLGPPTGTGAG
jgi:diamine N-acetyltransferase